MSAFKLNNLYIKLIPTKPLPPATKTFFELNTWLGIKDKIKATPNEDYYLTINKKNIGHLSVSLEYDGPIEAPIMKGDKIGLLSIYENNDLVKQVDLLSSEHIKKSNILKRVFTSLNYLVWGDV